MADREKLIELLDEAEEHSTDICVYNSDCKDCPGGKYGNKCRDYLKADYLISHGVTVRERGRWEQVDHDGSWRVDRCSVCHRRMHYVDYDQPYQFCPNCGADMRPKGEGEEDGN